MMSVRTIDRSVLLFHFLTIPFLLLLLITLALDGLTAFAEPPVGSVHAVIAKARPSVVTIQRKNAQATISLLNPSLPKVAP
jgi:hypothetical protein